MSLEKISTKEKKSRYREWRERRKHGEEIALSDVKKIIELNRILRSDGKKLGITQVAIEIIPRKINAVAVANDAGYRIKGDGMFNMPSSITFEYRAVDILTKEELRSLAWHEFGHFIFAYFFPKVDDKYWKEYNYYATIEAFADEFAYKRFGDTYVRAIEKTTKLAKDKKDKQVAETNLKDIKRMAAYRKKYHKPFWTVFAKQSGVDIIYGPKESKLVGVNPPKSILEGLYSEE